MIEVQLNTRSLQKCIVNFHANTVTFYYATGTTPYIYHVGHLKSFEIVDNKGKYLLKPSTGFKDISEEFDATVLPKVQELVGAVQKAMRDFQANQ